MLVFDDAQLLDDRTGSPRFTVDRRNPAGIAPGARRPHTPEACGPFDLALARHGKLHEVGPADLALSRREAGSALRATGISVSDADLTTLMEETEGWPAGIARPRGALERRRSTDGACARVTTSSSRSYGRNVWQRSSRKSGRSCGGRSILDRMCGALCDATLESTASATMLDSLVAIGVFLVPLDRRSDWFRYHHLLRDSLRQELLTQEPELVAELHRNAAGWLERHGDSSGALRHAHAAGTKGDFARIFGTAGAGRVQPRPVGGRAGVACRPR